MAELVGIVYEETIFTMSMTRSEVRALEIALISQPSGSKAGKLLRFFAQILTENDE